MVLLVSCFVVSILFGIEYVSFRYWLSGLVYWIGTKKRWFFYFDLLVAWSNLGSRLVSAFVIWIGEDRWVLNFWIGVWFEMVWLGSMMWKRGSWWERRENQRDGFGCLVGGKVSENRGEERQREGKMREKEGKEGIFVIKFVKLVDPMWSDVGNRVRDWNS